MRFWREKRASEICRGGLYEFNVFCCAGVLRPGVPRAHGGGNWDGMIIFLWDVFGLFFVERVVFIGVFGDWGTFRQLGWASQVYQLELLERERVMVAGLANGGEAAELEYISVVAFHIDVSFCF